ncbi:hypothetical protein D9M70_647160 [compost metagenome]
MQAHHFAGGLGELLQLLGWRPVGIGRGEHQHLAFGKWPPAFAVAASRRLGDGVQPGLGTQYHGKIHIHPGLD